MLIITLGALCLVAPSAANGATSDTILRDCVDGQIDGSYSRAALDDARGKIPSDVDEYSDCRGAIDQARVAGSSKSSNANSSGSSSGSSGGSSGGRGSSGGGSSGGAASGGGSSGAGSTGAGSSTAGPGASPTVNPTAAPGAQPAQPQGPSDQAVVKAALREGGSGVRLSPGTLVIPGSTGVPASESLRRSVPEPLLAVLIILGAIALVGAVLGTRARVLTRRLG